MEETVNFIEKLESFLGSECNDYGLSYSWDWADDSDFKIEATIKRNDLEEIEEVVLFDYQDGDLLLCMSYDCDVWEKVTEYDWRVKYFWMLIAPVVFPRG